MAHSFSSLVVPYATTRFMVKAIMPYWKPCKIDFILFWNYFFFFWLHWAACRTSLTRDWTHVPCSGSRVLTTRPPGRSMGLLTSVNGTNTHRFFEARNLGHSSFLPNHHHHHHHLIHHRTMPILLSRHLLYLVIPFYRRSSLELHRFLPSCYKEYEQTFWPTLYHTGHQLHWTWNLAFVTPALQNVEWRWTTEERITVFPLPLNKLKGSLEVVILFGAWQESSPQGSRCFGFS